ncbi:helix-turn-helix domain-containing protein [Flavobacterium amniphilum]|uniref:AraC family transcriptional regulator n=1 Tax=Flavobacterium amniphilum TaxID=1834035 RepID=UPI00202ABADF|nr:helix-turn-helix domain-containing protein [Flavobacterium amniphilum]MCL9807684.1 helix-turn-helix domain-containing protein [Flavobacterium amniphilum]
MHRKEIFISLIISLFCNISFAQKINQIPDSLKKLSYDDLREKIYNNSNSNFIQIFIYAQSNLLKAKKENDIREIIYGYDLFAEIHSDFDKSIKNSDTAIALAKKKYPKALPYLYSTRGYIFYNKKRLKESLNCFLLTLKDTTNLSRQLQNNVNYSIGMIRKTQGHNNEAISIYQQCMENALKNNDDNYLRYVLGLAELYHRVNKIDASEEFTNKGMITCKNYNFGNFYLPYFISMRGKNHLQKKRYNKAIIDLKSALSSFQKSNDFSNYAENCFYLGESYSKLNQDDKAIIFYKKVDSIFTAKNDIALLIIPAYNHLIDYYKKHQNYKEAMYYSDQFIKADKVLDENYRYITDKITKNYDIHNVVSSKQTLISSLKKEKISLKSIIVLLFFGIISLLVLLYLNHKKREKEIEKQKQLFETFKKERELQISLNHELTKPISKKASIDNIDETVVSHILDSLQKFEKELRFIEKEYTIEILASEFKTNSNYLSKVINVIKECTFTQYINNLRIEYILEKLETDKKTLNYTIQALSEICGYNSVQTFTRAFTAYTNMKPSNFIKELKYNNLKN